MNKTPARSCGRNTFAPGRPNADRSHDERQPPESPVYLGEIAVQHDGRYYRCPECDKRYASTIRLCTHLRQKHGIDPRGRGLAIRPKDSLPKDE